MTDENLDKILHDLDHQRAEAIGVETLATQASHLISITTIVEQVLGQKMSSPQRAAAFAVLGKWLREDMCPVCIDLSVRIENQIDKEFKEFMAKKKAEEEKT